MRPEQLNPLFTSLDAIPRVGPKLGRLVGRLCGPVVVDVLWHLPTGVNHRPYLTKAADVVYGAFGTFAMTITQHQVPPTRRQPYRIFGEGLGLSIELVFFNYHKNYLQNTYPEGKTIWVSGKLETQTYGGGIRILHPDYVTEVPNSIPEFEVMYPQSQGVTSKLLRRIVTHTLSELPDLPEWIDEALCRRERWPSWKQALFDVHHPKTQADLNPLSSARKRLAYDELLANQLALLIVRQRNARQKGIVIESSGALVQKLVEHLPFTLTGAQKRVLSEIKADLSSEHQMIRLLQGDVGSGKTIVALLSSLTVIEGGYQAALMAPTDILARQHFAKIEALCKPLGVQVALLTAREKGRVRTSILTDVASGKIQILIGTHALLTEEVRFHRLGLAIVDEQHKFGVEQRLNLLKKEKGVNLLVMTATPIPRSLALTFYGDMDMSLLDEKPVGRQPIETRVMSVSKIPELVERLSQKIKNSASRTQVYWICPLVEESEKTDLTAVKERFKMLQETFGNRVGLVHGKMKGAEKDAVMMQFSAGELDVLVSTTVIEVGVDVKSATIMVIEQAERFGLAGLHQLRGRVGRGSDKSLCLLLHGKQLTDTAHQRLQIMRETDDGFVLAEADLKLRGAGEVLGTRQSGLQAFHLSDVNFQSEWLLTATKDAQTVLALDPKLETPRGKALRLLLYLFKKDVEIQTLKSG